MASAHSWLFVFSTCFSAISTLLMWLLLLVRVDAQDPNRMDEVQLLINFQAEYEAERIFYHLYDDTPQSEGQSTGYWDSWNEADKNPCAWVGVTCTSNFTVKRLDLSGWGLSTISGVRYLSQLRDLRELDLSSNNLGSTDWSGQGSPTPDKAASFAGLTWLDLSRNNLVGTVPLNITLCRGLRYLVLDQNSLNDLPNLTNYGNLHVLSVAENILTTTFPTGLGEVSSLVSLDMSSNQLSGNIPSFSKLTNLLYLALDGNEFTGFEDPESPLPTSLRRLTITGSKLQGQIPPGLANMLSLEVLNMSNNQLTGEIPSGLALQQNHSFWLDLSQNLLTGQIPAELLLPPPAGDVASLNLSQNNLSGSIPIPFDGGPQPFVFDILDLSHNHLSGPIPFIYNNASTVISSLWLQNNHLSGDLLEFLARNIQSGFHHTTDLRFQNNLFSGDLSKMAHLWTNMLYLQALDMSNNNLQMTTSEALPDPLRTTLQSFGTFSIHDLLIRGNDFSGTSLPGGLNINNGTSQLRVLDLSNCHLQGEISGSVFESTWFPFLRTLNLSNNEIKGPLLEAVVTLPNLVSLHVSNNHLSGPLPMISPRSSLNNPSFFSGNALCGEPLPPCSSIRTVVHWWVYLIIALFIIMAVGSCLAVVWQWRVYHRRHQQDADLIKTLMERESAVLMSLRELKKATNNFSDITKIGEGGFGNVYMGKLNDGTKVAIKRSKREGSEKDKEQFLNEVRILSQVSHRNLVKLLGCCMENKIALLVFEFVSNGTLQQHLRGKIVGGQTLSWKRRLGIGVQTADALTYLHSATTFPIYHRDVKSANILLTDDLNAKVADFGISKLAPIEATHVSNVTVQGTLGYIDPEYYTTYQLTSKSDVYSFGVVLLELISAKLAIDLKRDEDEANLVEFARPLMQSGDLQRFIDYTLQDTYNDPSMRESILKVGRLAIECLDQKSKFRPSMYEVWMVLRNLSLELDDTSKCLSSIREDSNERISA